MAALELVTPPDRGDEDRYLIGVAKILLELATWSSADQERIMGQVTELWHQRRDETARAVTEALQELKRKLL